MYAVILQFLIKAVYSFDAPFIVFVLILLYLETTIGLRYRNKTFQACMNI